MSDLSLGKDTTASEHELVLNTRKKGFCTIAKDKQGGFLPLVMNVEFHCSERPMERPKRTLQLHSAWSILCAWDGRLAVFQEDKLYIASSLFQSLVSKVTCKPSASVSAHN